LQNLPVSLDATYERIIHTVPSMYSREVKAALMLLAFSTRPMLLQEVAEATAIRVDEQKFDIEDRFLDPNDLLEYCSSLVSLSAVPQEHYSEIRRESGINRFGYVASDIKVIQFAHMSVKEYLLSDRTKKVIPEQLFINAHLAHSQITRMSLIYLLDFNGGKSTKSFDHEEYPFLAYSALHWMTHLSQVPDSDREDIDALLLRLFDADNDGSLRNALNLYDPTRKFGMKQEKELGWGGFRRHKSDFHPPIYYACLYGLDMIAKYLLSDDSGRKPSAEVLGSALAAAASKGHAQIVDMLLQYGADVNSQYCGEYWRPLHAAADGGNPLIVKRLLEAGADVHAQSGYDGGALNAVMSNGNPEIIQMLIDHGHDLYTAGQYSGKPLSAAAKNNLPEAIAVLLRNGYDVNNPPTGYFNPLNLACEYCDVDSVRLLLDHGAEASLKRVDSEALHNAAEAAKIDILKLLLERGGGINAATGGTYGSPLKGAIQSREDHIFDFMLRNGADINFQGGDKKYPVDVAIFGGNLKAADKLLELGAKFSDKALEEALDYDKKEYLAKILIDRGADVNAPHTR
jgi:ankyrin repeat protein